jgi:hypothetical protein
MIKENIKYEKITVNSFPSRVSEWLRATISVSEDSYRNLVRKHVASVCAEALQIKWRLEGRESGGRPVELTRDDQNFIDSIIRLFYGRGEDENTASFLRKYIYHNKDISIEEMRIPSYREQMANVFGESHGQHAV